MRVNVGPFELGPLHLASIAVVLVLVSVLLGVLVNSARQPADTQSEAPPPLRYEWATADRLVLPEDFAGSDELEWVPRRPRREVWTDDQIADYWLDPDEIGREVLDDQVEEHIRALLQEVP